MAGIQVRVVLSVVQVLIVGVGFFAGTFAYAVSEGNGPCAMSVKPPNTLACDYGLTCMSLGQAVGNTCQKSDGGSSGGGDCSSAVSQLNSSISEVSRDCTQAGMSTTNCISAVQSCASNTMQSSGFQMQNLATLFGAQGAAAAQAMNAGQSNSCPGLSYQEWQQQSKELQGEIKDAQKDSTDLDKQIADSKKEVDTAVKDAQDKISQLKKDLAKDTASNTKDQRQAATDQLQKVSDDTKSLQQASDDADSTRQAMNKCDQDFTSTMNNYSATLNQAACMKQVRDQMATLRSAHGNQTDLGNDVQIKKELQAVMDKCMLGLQTNFTNAQTAHTQCLQSGATKLQENATSQANLQNQITQDQTNSQESIADLKAAGAQLPVQEAQDEQNEQSNVNNVAQTVAQQQAALQKQQQTLANQILTYQQQLAALGTAPSQSTKTGWGDAQSGVNDYQSKAGSVRRACCTGGTPNSAGSTLVSASFCGGNSSSGGIVGPGNK